MAVTLTSVFGGVPDPYEDEGPVTDLNLQFDAVLSQTAFLDIVDIDLVPADPLDPPYTSITNIEVGVSLEGLVISVDELTENNETQLNIQYVAPIANVGILGDVTIETNIFNSSTQGNVEIFGLITNAFTDEFFNYVFLNDDVIITVVNINAVPNSNVNLHLYKPSFMRHNSILFYLNVEYDSSVTESFVLQKRVLNDWEIGRLALISKLNTIGI